MGSRSTASISRRYATTLGLSAMSPLITTTSGDWRATDSANRRRASASRKFRWMSVSQATRAIPRYPSAGSRTLLIVRLRPVEVFVQKLVRAHAVDRVGADEPFQLA